MCECTAPQEFRIASLTKSVVFMQILASMLAFVISFNQKSHASAVRKHHVTAGILLPFCVWWQAVKNTPVCIKRKLAKEVCIIRMLLHAWVIDTSM